MSLLNSELLACKTKQNKYLKIRSKRNLWGNTLGKQLQEKFQVKKTIITHKKVGVTNKGITQVKFPDRKKN